MLSVIQWMMIRKLRRTTLLLLLEDLSINVLLIGIAAIKNSTKEEKCKYGLVQSLMRFIMPHQ